MRLAAGLLYGVIFPLIWAPAPGWSEIAVGHSYNVREEAKETPVPFVSSDTVRLALDPPRRTTYMVGEPIVLTLRLCNHTQFAFQIRTDINPRGSFKIMVAAEGGKPRRYNGPYVQGNYLPQDYLLYPFEERPFSIILWGDQDTDSGLVFPKPGVYYVQMEMEIGAKLSPVKGYTWPLDPYTLQRQPPLVFNIVAPPQETAPLVDELSSAKAYPDLNLKHFPAKIEEAKVRELLKRYPATPISPYLAFALGINAKSASLANPEDQKLLEDAQFYLQSAAKADSAFKLDAYQELLDFYDKKGWAQPALDSCKGMMLSAPPQIVPLLGSLPIVRKYMINSAELDTKRYWEILN
ncbi:hypothetical protein HYR69_08175 [Candidatus Sumerlaeota bacterium]|nr:hypothetical protein [Candidatus Sumerlaeota bacterium]